jgi:NADH-quinone oxidoreductase subunit C
MKTDPELGFDYLECITGIDFPKDQRIGLVYHVYSYAKKHRMVLKVALDRSDPVAPSLTEVWSAANWQERECFDLCGVMFDGHPDLRRLLLPDDWQGHPLRKDWTPAAAYQGIPTTRPNPLELLGRAPKPKKPDQGAP